MFLAIDGGGTKTQLLLTQDDGTVVSQAQSGPLSLEAVDKKTAQENLFKALDLALKKSQLPQPQIKKCLIGLAGVDTQIEIENAKIFFHNIINQKFSCQCNLVNDTEIALASGSMAENAVVLIAGTGSNCVGRNSQGQKAKAGGLGYLLSDEGSGYFIGDKILRAAIQSFDGRSKKTILEESVRQRFQIENLAKLKEKINVHNFNKTVIAQLSVLLPQALNSNDQIAKNILKQTVIELLKMILAVARKLNLSQKEFDLVLAGSLFSAQVIDFDYFSASVKKYLSKVNCILPSDPPVYGALKLLLK